MASLAEVYNARGVSRRRLGVGVGLFLLGAGATVGGVLAATTEVATSAGLGVFEARTLAGVLAGLGLPAVFLGIVAVLPTSLRVRALALVGSLVAVAGVGLFQWAYPTRWIGGSGANLTLPVLGVYFIGSVTTCLCVFWAVAVLKSRNDPGGTVELEMTQAGARVVSVSRGLRTQLGGVGLLGSTPDGSTPTQTAGGRSTQRTDGGATTDDGLILEEHRRPGSLADPYCGNCAKFSYVRADGDIQPYCGHHRTVMDDMDPCPEWESNT